MERKKPRKIVQRIKVDQNFLIPLEDKKIAGKSWMVKMTVENYLHMVDVHSNKYQRNLQNLSFYKKLIEDLLDDTTMPPISVVYPETNINFEQGLRADKKFIILDGLQRTNCLLECLDIIQSGKSNGFFQSVEEFKNKLIYVEIWEKLDLKNILYKMVVLNTGQKKMDYAHQVEILSDSVSVRLKEAKIPFVTNKEKSTAKSKKPAEYKFDLSLITQGLVSFINKAPIPGKKNAAEFLFERFDISFAGQDEEGGLALINDEDTYQYLKWVLYDFDKILEQEYGSNNPLRKYDVFLVSLFASLGFCHSKNPTNLKRKVEVLINSFEEYQDPLRLGVFEGCLSKFKTSIGDKRRRFIFEAFKSYFLDNVSVDQIDWEYAYDRVH